MNDELTFAPIPPEEPQPEDESTFAPMGIRFYGEPNVSPTAMIDITDWPEWAWQEMAHLQDALHLGKRAAYEEREREMARIEVTYRKGIDRLRARYTESIDDLVVRVKKEQDKEGK